MEAPSGIAYWRKTPIYRGGEAKAAPKAEAWLYNGYGNFFGIYTSHRTLAQVRADEERAAFQARRIMDDRAKRAERRERLGKLCGTCRGRSVEWRVGHCPTCNNSGKRNP